jgi:riboflavin biosynthesis pyrimidine reductase
LVKRWVLLALVMVAVPSVVWGQGGRSGRGMGMGMLQSPLKVVLDHKADLSLSAEQVTQVETMETALTEKNKPSQDEIAKIREAHPDMRSMPEEARMKMRELSQTVVANNREAEEKLKDVLNADQLAAATKLIQESRPQRGRRGGGS